MRAIVGWVLEALDRPFCTYNVCLFVRFPFMSSLLWWTSDPVEEA